MKNKILLPLFMAMLGISQSNAQQLTIKEPLQHFGSVPEAECEKDSKGQKCAKIIIELAAPNISITSKNIIYGDVEHETGRYEFFVKTKNKKSKNFVTVTDGVGAPLTLALDADGGLKGGEAYRVMITREHNADAPMGAVDIRSYPDGADVFIDGKKIGQSPCQQRVYAQEEHTLTLVKDGYMTIDTIVSVAPEDIKTFSFAMRDGATRMRLRSDVAGATFSVDGDRKQAIPYNGEITYGPHNITFYNTYEDIDGKRMDYKPLKRDVIVEKGNTMIQENVVFDGAATLNITTKGRVPRTKIIAMENAKKDGENSMRGKDVHFENLYGRYMIEVKSAGTNLLKDTISIYSGMDVKRSYTMVPNKASKFIIAYRAMAKSIIGFEIGLIRQRSYFGWYIAGGGNIRTADHIDGKDSKTPENYLAGINSWYGLIGLIYNPNTWLYFKVGAGYGQYESAGYYLVGTTEKSTIFEPTKETLRGACLEGSINFSIGPIFMGCGYNTIVGSTMSPWQSNLFACFGFKFNLK